MVDQMGSHRDTVNEERGGWGGGHGWQRGDVERTAAPRAEWWGSFSCSLASTTPSLPNHLGALRVDSWVAFCLEGVSS